MDEKWFSYFDKGVERKNTECLKWDALGDEYNNPDAIALWVADMDFPAPQQVIDCMVDRAKHGAFGYAVFGDRHLQALHDWMLKRHGLAIEKDWVLCSEGVVDSMVFCLRAMARESSKIALLTPIYGPFYSMSAVAGYETYLSPLLLTEDGWKIDFDNLEDGFKKENVSVFMLCNPHNPVGRIWTKEELTRLISLCNQYGVKILSDEIHQDFEMPGYTQIPLLSLPGTEKCVSLCSATKTFNLAALRHSSIIAPDKEIRAAIQKEMQHCMAASPNLFGYLAQTAAYNYGAEWLNNLLQYLDGNRAFVEEYLAKNLPQCKTTRLQGTYLKFIDMRFLNMEHEETMSFFSQTAGLAFTSGTFFGEDGKGFVRMNIATQRKNLEEAMRRLQKAVESV